MTRKTVIQALREGERRLANASDSPRLDADVLLRHVLGIDRTQLLMRHHDPLTDDELTEFGRLIAARTTGMPVAYLTGAREFMRHPFRVRPGVLIPRPETELLVEWALRWLAAWPDATVADIGTGSGAIALSILLHAPATFHGRVIASDISDDALQVVEQNARNLLDTGQRSRLEIVQTDLASGLSDSIDLVLANLPYLKPGQIEENPALAAEPRLALDGGADGLTLINQLIDDLPRILPRDGAAVLEIDPSQAEAVHNRLEQTFPGASIHIIHDLAQFSRHVAMAR